jgi:NADPH:quinone reductase-like Zn-dependent oxidoreductase
MKQIWITKYGKPETLEIRESELSLPQSGQATIRVKAAGINFADIMARKGLYPDSPRLPFVPGYEVAGVVEAVGEGVNPSWINKSVFAFPRFGGYSERINLPIRQILETPTALSLEEAAALPVNYLTAFQLVIVMGSLRKGETILIHNAGGGVGLAALQIARHVGAITIGTSSASKHEFLKAQGLDHPIDYRSGDWMEKVMNLTNGRGVELILDPIGGAYWKKNYELLRPSGRLGMFGISSVSASKLGRIPAMLGMLTKIPFFNAVALMTRNRGVFGVNVGHLWHETEKVRGWMIEILAGVTEGWLRPHVDRSFKFEEAPLAHQYIEERRNIGKVVLTVE